MRYEIRYDGTRDQGGRDATDAHIWRVVTDASEFGVMVSMSRSAEGVLGDETGMNALLVAGLEEVEQRLTAGVLPEEGTDRLADICYTSDQVRLLVALRGREKSCIWQSRSPRGYLCHAHERGGDKRTTRALCAGCEIPDAGVVCAHLVHPQVEAVSTLGGHSRDAVLAFCNLGHDAGNGARCRPGAGMACWRRIVETTTELPEIPANVAKLAADEIDYLRLVFRDRYGFDVLTIPQARSVSELFGECGSEPDFHRRVAALADLLGHLAPWDALPDGESLDDGGSRVGSPMALERLMHRDYPEAVGHVQTLRLIPKARIMFPTHSRTSDAIDVMRALGVAYPATDWQVAWLGVLTAFWASAAGVRGAIQGGAPASDTSE